MKIACVALALGALGCASGAGSADQAPLIPEGRVAFRLTRMDGSSLTLAGLRGKPILLTVITTWADHALLEVPLYKALYERHRGRLQVVCVALDDDPQMVRIFEQTFEIPYVVAIVDDRAAFTGSAGPLGPIAMVPTSFLLDAEGRVAARMDGMWERGVLEAAVDQLLR